MRHAARQLPDAFHFLRFVKLLESDLTFARALDNGSFQFVVASPKRFARLDQDR